ncbi:unnamed protein product [Durusdinium trenchii]|uniref:PB1 domain-containing protein n=1 Tax=Durusdinium trenchii TaxID=1381693 RepID=A0ABP0ST54_9DINO
MGDATNETFEVTLQRQGPYPAQRHGFSCQATHEAVLARAIQLHEEHLAQREVDPSSVVLRFRDQDGQLLTIHDDLNLVRAMEEARDSQGLVQLDFLLQAKQLGWHLRRGSSGSAAVASSALDAAASEGVGEVTEYWKATKSKTFVQWS